MKQRYSCGDVRSRDNRSPATINCNSASRSLSRRRLIEALAGAACTGGAILIAPQQTLPDISETRLISAAVEYAALARHIRRILDERPAAMTEHEVDAAREIAFETIASRQEKLRQVMEDTPARTRLGLHAKAAVLKEWIPQTLTGDGPHKSEDGLAWSLVSDILAGGIAS